MKKSERNWLYMGGAALTALYFIGKANPMGAAAATVPAPATPASSGRGGRRNRGMGYYQDGGYQNGTGDPSQFDDPGNIMWQTPPNNIMRMGDPNNIMWQQPPGGDPSSGGHPHWRQRWGRHIRDANSTSSQTNWPWWFNQIEYGHPWGPGGDWWGGSRVEYERPGSIATMASEIDAGAY